MNPMFFPGQSVEICLFQVWISGLGSQHMLPIYDDLTHVLKSTKEAEIGTIR